MVPDDDDDDDDNEENPKRAEKKKKARTRREETKKKARANDETKKRKRKRRTTKKAELEDFQVTHKPSQPDDVQMAISSGLAAAKQTPPEENAATGGSCRSIMGTSLLGDSDISDITTDSKAFEKAQLTIEQSCHQGLRKMKRSRNLYRAYPILRWTRTHLKLQSSH